MLPDYDDIRSRIDEEPSFFDDRGVPRYGDFEPRMLGIYDKYAILVRIGCQGCNKQFLVAHGWNDYESLFQGRPAPTLEYVAANFHYGDPPRHGCVGDTMNCLDYETVEVWEQGGFITKDDGSMDTKASHTWHRKHEYEQILEDHPDYS